MTVVLEDNAPRIAVAAHCDQDRMRALAARLCVPLAPASSTDFDWMFVLEPDGALALVDTRVARVKPLRIDLNRRIRRVGSREPLRRAVGRGVKTVVDATAGLAGDTRLLLTMGLEVTAVDRSAIIAVLFEDAVRRAAGTAEPLSRLRFIQGDSGDVLAALSEPPDVVFIDPMYPAGRKPSALPRKECRILRALVGADGDAARLVATARRYTRRRVVVKRPLYAPPIADGRAAAHQGKQVRYDVYVASRQ